MAFELPMCVAGLTPTIATLLIRFKKPDGWSLAYPLGVADIVVGTVVSIPEKARHERVVARG
jgi:hypothetical protein